MAPLQYEPRRHRETGPGGVRRSGAHKHKHKRSDSPIKAGALGTSPSGTQDVSTSSLGKTDAENTGLLTVEKAVSPPEEKIATGIPPKRHRNHRRKGGRVVSGALLEEGSRAHRRSRGGDGAYDDEYPAQKNGRRLCFLILIAIIVFLLVILVPVGVLVIGKHKDSNATKSAQSAVSSTATSSPRPSITVPTSAKGSLLDPSTWYDTTDFNLTYTEEKVGGLSVMGLNSTWDDSTQANEFSLPLNHYWNYSTQNPIRGVNIGGWLSIEPWITPSLFSIYSSNLGIVDEYTLSDHLGLDKATQLIEKHYATFVTEQTFADIQDAGLDHVRIPFPYWAVRTYPGDPYVPQIAWRYLLRGIEWARKHGLRVNLDLHALPGSQNGWNHSGRQGVVGWLNGTDGDLNGQRALDVHDQLSTFFAQDRYQNIVTIYGLCNEPKMMMLDTDRVVNWTEHAIDVVRKNNKDAYIVFGDGFLGLAHWQGKLQGYDKLILDAHQYVIFNVAQISLNHQSKIEFACGGWTAQTEQSMDRSTGFGPTINGEWSQADTDCAKYLNNVNVGSRWEGTMNMNDPSLNVLAPMCPPNSGTCECRDANADPTTYTPVYKQWLKMFAEAQMASFEKGWGWFYWTWQTETSPQWSWKAGVEAGILPKKAYKPDFNCSTPVPDFKALGLPETY